MISTCCFLVFKSFHKQDICQWATASIVVADGFAVLAFWRILHHSLPMGSFVLNNCAVIHKVAQCVIPMHIRYILIYFIHHIRTGPLHMFKLFSSWICIPHQPHKVTSGQMTVTISYEQKAGSLSYTEHSQ